MLYHAGKEKQGRSCFWETVLPVPSKLGKKCHVPSRAQGCAHCGERCLLGFHSPPEPSVPCAGKKSKLTVQTKKKQGEKIKGNTKGKDPSAQKKEAANTPEKKDTKVNMICTG